MRQIVNVDGGTANRTINVTFWYAPGRDITRLLPPLVMPIFFGLEAKKLKWGFMYCSYAVTSIIYFYYGASYCTGFIMCLIKHFSDLRCQPCLLFWWWHEEYCRSLCNRLQFEKQIVAALRHSYCFMEPEYVLSFQEMPNAVTYSNPNKSSHLLK
jgi:hypothetical protein